MRLVPGRRFAEAATAAQWRELIDATAVAYADWASGVPWSRGRMPPVDRGAKLGCAYAFPVYLGALDREEDAARAYGGLMVAARRYRNQAGSPTGPHRRHLPPVTGVGRSATRRRWA